MEIILFNVLIIVSFTIRFIGCDFSDGFNYEKMHRFGLGRRIIPDYRRLNPNTDFGFGDLHPEPLPEPKKKPYEKTPYHTIYQGKRKLGDRKVFIKKFKYGPQNYNGQRYFCEARLDCIINHVVVRTDGGIPIIIRGGVGYRHFYIVARAKVGQQLNGNVTIYCVKQPERVGRRQYQYGILSNRKKLPQDGYS